MNISVNGLLVHSKADLYPYINTDWRLKRSGEWCILQKYGIDESSFCRLSPLASATIPLFDGTKSLREIVAIVAYSHRLTSPNLAWRFVNEIISQINCACGDAIVFSQTEITNTYRYNPIDFIVSPSRSKEQVRLHSPISIGLMFSNQCQTDCLYCYAERRKIKLNQHLSNKRWVELFHEINNIGIDVVTLSGGDPLHRKDSTDLLIKLVELKKLFLVSTKCHFKDNIANKLTDAGFNEVVNGKYRQVQISLDSTDESTADLMAGTIGYCKKALNSIDNLQKYGFHFNVKAVVTPYNVKQLIQYADTLHERGVTRIRFVAYSRSFYNHSDDLFLSKEESALYGDKIKSIRERYPDMDILSDGRFTLEDSQIASEKKMERWRERAGCSGGRTSLTITPDGNVILCDQIPQDSWFVVGNVKEKSIQDVWRSSKLLEFIYPNENKFIETPCFNCNEKHECREIGGGKGYCFRDSFFISGNQYSPPPSCPKALVNSLRMN